MVRWVTSTNAAWHSCKRNLHHVQAGRSFNSPARLEIPEEVFEELLVNALVHRDYFISAPIRLLIFADRVEIISPGHLPDHLNTDQIRYGLSNLRNPALASHAFHILPYRGRRQWHSPSQRRRGKIWS